MAEPGEADVGYTNPPTTNGEVPAFDAARSKSLAPDGTDLWDLFIHIHVELYICIYIYVICAYLCANMYIIYLYIYTCMLICIYMCI